MHWLSGQCETERRQCIVLVTWSQRYFEIISAGSEMRNSRETPRASAINSHVSRFGTERPCKMRFRFTRLIQACVAKSSWRMPRERYSRRTFSRKLLTDFKFILLMLRVHCYFVYCEYWREVVQFR